MRSTAIRKITALVTLLFTFATAGGQETVNAAVASNFTRPMKELAVLFERQSGHRVRLSFGSSGKTYAQIINGAPFHLFLSADQKKPIALERHGLVMPDSRYTYALGALALWSPGNTEVRELLESGRYRKLALANPKLAPYGAAAVEALKRLGLLAESRSRWVRGENITQAYQFVRTGNADMGLLSVAQFTGCEHGSGSVWVVPIEYYPPIRQDLVLLKSAADNVAAHQLHEYLRSDEARSIIESSGYGLPTLE